jgi:hypothetical protein
MLNSLKSQGATRFLMSGWACWNFSPTRAWLTTENVPAEIQAARSSWVFTRAERKEQGESEKGLPAPWNFFFHVLFTGVTEILLCQPCTEGTAMRRCILSSRSWQFNKTVTFSIITHATCPIQVMYQGLWKHLSCRCLHF